jgi:aldehyde dehydrogenase (NAD+)
VVKPSAYSPATSSIIAKLLEESFAQGHVAVIEGGRQENQALFEQKFDYLFFTGSAAVGKNVMEAASKHLTPVSLELGGKSPCIVCADADIDLAARRIIWGKTLNAGQTCVAPDYVLVQRAVKPQLIERMKHYITEFFGDNPCKNEEFPKIINEKHFLRVSGYLSCGTVAAGGETDAQALKISPTILTDVSWDQPVMQEEIFGPVLPVIAFDDTGEAINLIIGRPKPLALYLFTKSKRTQAEITDRVSFGGGCINDTIVHLATPYMPFGGVGESGMGGYHGKYSFDTFTHKKSILQKSNILDIKLRYPPYRGKFALLKKLMG